VYFFFSGKVEIMSSGSPPTQFYERRKKSRRGVDTGEGGSSNPLLPRSTKRTAHRDHPKGHMHIDTEIEEVEEDPMETSDNKSIEDETYRVSPVPPSENNTEEDNESNGSGARGEVENEEEEGMAKGTLNPKSHKRGPFDLSPTIRIPHKSLQYVVANYKGKGAVKKVKKL
jgi:hypothetical protein